MSPDEVTLDVAGPVSFRQPAGLYAVRTRKANALVRTSTLEAE